MDLLVRLGHKLACLFSKLPGNQGNEGNMIMSVIHGLMRRKQQEKHNCF